MQPEATDQGALDGDATMGAAAEDEGGAAEAEAEAEARYDKTAGDRREDDGTRHTTG